MKLNCMYLATTAWLGSCGLFNASLYAQFDPDVGIFDAEANGAGPNSGSNQRSGRSGPMITTSGIPIGGNVSILDESSLPPLGTINVPSGTSLNIPVNLPGMP